MLQLIGCMAGSGDMTVCNVSRMAKLLRKPLLSDAQECDQA